MKATGIVRRIDDLGRVVVPKEIRRTMRIREGDPLEIYTDKDGEVIFKKYSLMGDLGEFANNICENLNRSTGHTTAICDRDSVIAAVGGSRRDLLEKRISGDLEQLMERRQVYQSQAGETSPQALEGDERHRILTAAPILCEGDVLGCVFFLGEEGARPQGDTEYKLVQTVAGFLGKHMES